MDFVQILLIALGSIVFGVYLHWLSHCIGDGWYGAKFKKLNDFLSNKTK